jgi:hypothetical protein
MISAATQRTPAASAPQWGTELRRRSERLAHFEVPTAWSIHSEPLPTNASANILEARIRRDWDVSVASLDSG